MNKRLKELAEQAGLEELGDGDWCSLNHPDVRGADLEHFAELVRQDEREELKTTYPQGAKVRPAEFIAAASIGVGADFIGTPMMWAEFPTRPERTFVVHDVGCAVNGYGECDCLDGVEE